MKCHYVFESEDEHYYKRGSPHWDLAPINAVLVIGLETILSVHGG